MVDSWQWIAQLLKMGGVDLGIKRRVKNERTTTSITQVKK
jgi:hypothetical protein